MEEQTIQIVSNVINPADLIEPLEQELAGSGIELQLNRSPDSSERFDFGLILAGLVGLAKLVPLITAVAALVKRQRPTGQIRLLAADGTTILEVPADTSTERIEELLKLQTKGRTPKEIQIA
jgi:hypothetical protein